MVKKRVLIFGGRGFVGSHLSDALGKRYEVFSFDRHEGEGNHIQGDILDENDVESAVKGKDYVVNLIGLSPLRERAQRYEDVHVKGVVNIIKSCRKFKVKKYVHMSALGADKNSDVEYLKTKGLGEEVVNDSGINYLILCPSVIFGEGSELIGVLVKLSKFRMFPNVSTRIQPIYVKDLSELVMRKIEMKGSERVETGGPEVMTLFDIAKLVYGKLNRPCMRMPMLFVELGIGFAATFGLFGIGYDQIKMLNKDNVVRDYKYAGFTRLDSWLDESEARKLN